MNIASMTPVVIFTLLNVAMALGLYVTALSGQLSMATAAIAGVGGYLAAVLTVNFGWAFVPAICMGAAGGTLVGTLLALVTLKMRDFILKLTTLAFGEALSVLAFNWDYIGGANSFTGIGLKTNVWIALAAALIALYVAWRFDGSRLGFACRAVRDDPLAASAMGVSIARMRTTSFALGAALVGMAGAIQALRLRSRSIRSRPICFSDGHVPIGPMSASSSCRMSERGRKWGASPVVAIPRISKKSWRSSPTSSSTSAPSIQLSSRLPTACRSRPASPMHSSMVASMELPRLIVSLVSSSGAEMPRIHSRAMLKTP